MKRVERTLFDIYRVECLHGNYVSKHLELIFHYTRCHKSTKIGKHLLILSSCERHTGKWTENQPLQLARSVCCCTFIINANRYSIRLRDVLFSQNRQFLFTQLLAKCLLHMVFYLFCVYPQWLFKNMFAVYSAYLLVSV